MSVVTAAGSAENTGIEMAGPATELGPADYLVLVLGGAEHFIAGLVRKVLLAEDAGTVVTVASPEFWTHSRGAGAVKCPAKPPNRCTCPDAAGAADGWGHSTHPCGNPVVSGHAGVGKLVIRTKAAPNTVMELPWAQSVMALVWTSGEGRDSDGLAATMLTSEKAEAVAAFASLVSTVDHNRWHAALRLWEQCQRALGGSRAMSEGEIPTFRASCVRDGPHSFKSTDCYAIIADAFLSAADSNWKVGLEAPDMEVVGVVLWDHIVLGLTLSKSRDRQFRNGKIAGEAGHKVADGDVLPPGNVVLRPSTAMALLAMAHAMHDNGSPTSMTIWDPCSGTGTIASAVSTAIKRGCLTGWGIGGEIEAVHVADQDASWSDFMRTDARAVPLRDGVVDAVVTDLPFGLRCMKRKGLEQLYMKLVTEVERVLSGHGLIVALTAQVGSRLLAEALSTGPWEQVPQWPSPMAVNVGGLACHVFIARRARGICGERHSAPPPSKRQRRREAVDEGTKT